MHLALEQRREAAKAKGEQGPRDVGKTSLSKILLAYALRQSRQPIFVDLDGSITMPGTLTATPINQIIDVEEGFGSSATTSPSLGSSLLPIVYYYGYSDPGENIKLYKVLTTKLAQSVKRRIAEDEDGSLAPSSALPIGIDRKVSETQLVKVEPDDTIRHSILALTAANIRMYKRNERFKKSYDIIGFTGVYGFSTVLLSSPYICAIWLGLKVALFQLAFPIDSTVRIQFIQDVKTLKEHFRGLSSKSAALTTDIIDYISLLDFDFSDPELSFKFTYKTGKSFTVQIFVNVVATIVSKLCEHFKISLPKELSMNSLIKFARSAGGSSAAKPTPSTVQTPIMMLNRDLAE
ncbi:13289_t:CDS:2, partial [Racocetra fulgida]